MTIGLALILVTLLLRWPAFAEAVYPISQWVVNLQRRHAGLSAVVGVLPLVLFAVLPPSGRAVLVCLLLPLIFAGTPFFSPLPTDPGAQAERIARVIRRYFVPLPLLATLGIWGLALLWLLRFGWVPRRGAVRRWLNLRTGQLVGIHLMLWRRMRPLTEWMLTPGRQSVVSLYQWSLELVTRTTREYRFRDLWRTLALIRWQWIGATVVLQLLLN